MTRKPSSRIAVYVRVSTLDQEKGVQSQDHAIRTFLAGHGMAGATWYRDRLSGETTNRPAFDRLQRDIFAGKVRTVVCWKLDRLSRTQRGGINLLCDWLERSVCVVAVSQQLDFTGIDAPCLRHGQVQGRTVIVSELSRLGRSVSETVMAKRRTSKSRDDEDAKFLPSEDVIQKRAETLRWLQEHGLDRQFIETMMQHDFENALPQYRRMAEINGKSVERIELLYCFLLDD